MAKQTAAQVRPLQRRDAIVHCAVELFSTQSYEEVSVDAVCDRAGVAHGLVFYYFGGKRGLYIAAAKQAWEELVEYERPREDERSSADRVRGYVGRHLDYVARNRERFTTLMHAAHADGEVAEIVAAARESAVADIAARLGCPVNPPPLLRVAIKGWVGYLDSVTVHWLASDDLDADQVADLAVDALVAAVRSASGRHYIPSVELAALDQVSGKQAGPAATTKAAARRRADHAG